MRCGSHRSTRSNSTSTAAGCAASTSLSLATSSQSASCPAPAPHRANWPPSSPTPSASCPEHCHDDDKGCSVTQVLPQASELGKLFDKSFYSRNFRFSVLCMIAKTFFLAKDLHRIGV